MAHEALGTRVDFEPMSGEPKQRPGLRQDVAALIAALERGEPAETAIELLGFDRQSGARRVLRGLRERP